MDRRSVLLTAVVISTVIFFCAVTALHQIGGRETPKPSKLSSVTVEVGDYGSLGYTSMKVLLEGEADSYSLTLSGPSKSPVGTAFVSSSDMADQKESVLLPMVSAVERFTPAEPGTYTLVIEDSAGNKVYENCFTYAGANLLVESWGVPEFELGESGYYLVNLSVTVSNDGDLSTYVTDVKVAIGEEETASSLADPAEVVILPGETDTLDASFYLGPFGEGTYSATYALRRTDTTLATHSTTIQIPEPLPVNQVLPLRVSFIDVGQGDSVYIKTPAGRDVLIDGGKRGMGDVVVNYLRNQGVDDIELVIATHPDADHVGGLISVLGSFVVEEVWDPGFEKDTATYRDFVTAVKAEGCPFLHPHRGSAVDIDPYLVEEILNPPETLYSDSNDSSIVLKIEFGTISFLFTGDIGAQVEGDILAEGFEVSSTVLKVAHHGSKYSSALDFLTAVDPEVAVISVGADNPYGHPAQETLDKLASVGAEVYRTDLCGTIVIETDGTTYTVSTEK